MIEIKSLLYIGLNWNDLEICIMKLIQKLN